MSVTTFYDINSWQFQDFEYTSRWEILSHLFTWFVFRFRNNFDDTEDAIEKRIVIYNEKTKQVASKNNAKVINADRTAEEIFEDLQKVLEAM